MWTLKKLDFTFSMTGARVADVFPVMMGLCFLSCRNLGQKERAYVEVQMRTLDEGLRLKQQLIEEGVLLWREKQVRCILLQ